MKNNNEAYVISKIYKKDYYSIDLDERNLECNIRNIRMAGEALIARAQVTNMNIDDCCFVVSNNVAEVLKLHSNFDVTAEYNRLEKGLFEWSFLGLDVIYEYIGGNVICILPKPKWRINESMDADKAIRTIEDLLEVGGSDGFNSSEKEALNMAIEALRNN